MIWNRYHGQARRWSRRDERGAAAVEFALVALPLIILVFGIIEFGWIFHQQVALSNASREAARFYAVHQSQPFDAAICGPYGATWKDCAEAIGEAAAPTVDWGTGAVTVSNTCAATGEKTVTAVATIDMPSLSGYFDGMLPAGLSAQGRMLCGG